MPNFIEWFEVIQYYNYTGIYHDFQSWNFNTPTTIVLLWIKDNFSWILMNSVLMVEHIKERWIEIFQGTCFFKLGSFMHSCKTFTFGIAIRQSKELAETLNCCLIHFEFRSIATHFQCVKAILRLFVPKLYLSLLSWVHCLNLATC